MSSQFVLVNPFSSDELFYYCLRMQAGFYNDNVYQIMRPYFPDPKYDEIYKNEPGNLCCDEPTTFPRPSSLSEERFNELEKFVGMIVTVERGPHLMLQYFVDLYQQNDGLNKVMSLHHRISHILEAKILSPKCYREMSTILNDLSFDMSTLEHAKKIVEDGQWDRNDLRYANEYIEYLLKSIPSIDDAALAFIQLLDESECRYHDILGYFERAFYGTTYNLGTICEEHYCNQDGIDVSKFVENYNEKILNIKPSDIKYVKDLAAYFKQRKDARVARNAQKEAEKKRLIAVLKKAEYDNSVRRRAKKFMDENSSTLLLSIVERLIHLEDAHCT